jgi:hypothetical protein
MASRIIYLAGGERVNLRVEVATDAGLFMSFSFTSVCPKCKEARFQAGFGIRTLLRLLRHNEPIEAYCIGCDEFWPISESDRDALGRGLVDGESHGRS